MKAVFASGIPSDPALTRGFFARPTLFVDVQDSMRIAQEETFGPVLIILTYKALDKTLTTANDSMYGLDAGTEACNKS